MRRGRRLIYGRDGLITRVKRVWLLSGTLAPNHPGELWTHYKALFGGPLSYWDFVNRYCIVKETTYGTQIIGANLARAPELAANFCARTRCGVAFRTCCRICHRCGGHMCRCCRSTCRRSRS